MGRIGPQWRLCLRGLPQASLCQDDRHLRPRGGAALLRGHAGVDRTGARQPRTPWHRRLGDRRWRGDAGSFAQPPRRIPSGAGLSAHDFRRRHRNAVSRRPESAGHLGTGIPWRIEVKGRLRHPPAQLCARPRPRRREGRRLDPRPIPHHPLGGARRRPRPLDGGWHVEGQAGAGGGEWLYAGGCFAAPCGPHHAGPVERGRDTAPDRGGTRGTGLDVGAAGL